MWKRSTRPTSAPDRACSTLFDLPREVERPNPLIHKRCSTVLLVLLLKLKEMRKKRRKRRGLSSSASLLSSRVAILAKKVEQAEQVEQSLMLLDFYVFGFWDEVDQVEHARLIAHDARNTSAPAVALTRRPRLARATDIGDNSQRATDRRQRPGSSCVREHMRWSRARTGWLGMKFCKGPQQQKFGDRRNAHEKPVFNKQGR